MVSKTLKYTALTVMAFLVCGGHSMAADTLDHAEPTAAASELSVHDDEGNVHVIDLEHPQEEHHASAGLPQMDTAWFPSQIFWLAITFGFLYVVFSKKVLPGISSTLESRRNQIQEDLDFAKDLKEEAEKTHQAYEEILTETRNKASVMFVKLDEDIKKQTTKQYESLQQKTQDKIQETEQMLDDVKKSAMTDMQAIAAEIASMAAHKIIGVNTDIDQAKTLVKNIGKKAA